MCFSCYCPTLGISLALTPAERWDAVGRGLGGGSGTQNWLTPTALAALMILAVLLLMVSWRRRVQERRAVEQMFLDHCDRRGLSVGERQILRDLASKSGLKQSCAIFTTADAFERGAVRILEQQHGAEQRRWLRSELSFLREKLGFQGQAASSVGLPARPRKLSSRQISVGTKVRITRRKARDSEEIEAAVVENNDVELMIRPAVAVKVILGEPWRVRYCFGAVIWEFDTSVISYDGEILVLNHNDDMRFINRRRFLRVQVNRPALVARFPFTRTLPAESASGGQGSGAGRVLSKASAAFWGPPGFVSGVVTELAGPGLRIEVPLQVEAGDRVLVVVRLDDKENGNSTSDSLNAQSAASKIVEDIGEVRHARQIQNGMSIAVELTGLSNSDVDELIRATNLAYLRAKAGRQEISGTVKAGEGAGHPASVGAV